MTSPKLQEVGDADYPSTNDLAEFLATGRKLVDQTMDSLLPGAEQEPSSVHRCIRYSVEGGKRLRPIVALAVAQAFDCPPQKVLPTCAALEMIHTHSLILDDLPCMDDDDYRRGRPASHKLFGESIALLAADALLNLAIGLLGSNHRISGVSPETALEIIKEVGDAVGTAGVIGGQAADLIFAGLNGEIDNLERIHLGKTAALFRLSARAGALIAGATPSELELVGSYGENLGLSFQIVDDLLDHQRQKNHPRRHGQMEPNYATMCGAAAARSSAEEALGRALAALDGLAAEVAILRMLGSYNLARTE